VRATSNRLTVIGAPTSAGEYAPGQEKTPEAFRRHGLILALERVGWQVRDMGDVSYFRWRPDPGNPKSMNLGAVHEAARAVCQHVARAMADGEAALVLGGDCTIELGVVAGALTDDASVGLIYIDGDADLNVPETAEGSLDWTGIAHMLDLPGALPDLSGLASRRPMLRPSEVLLFALMKSQRPSQERSPAITSDILLWRRSKQIRRLQPNKQGHGDADLIVFSFISTLMCLRSHRFLLPRTSATARAAPVSNWRSLARYLIPSWPHRTGAHLP
jgi:hypothetical protein